MQLYEKIGLMRKMKGWSQEDMAERLGMSVNGYAKIERGETDVQFSRLQKISELMEISLLELLNVNSNINITSCWSYHEQFNQIQGHNEHPDIRLLKQEIDHLKQLLEQKDREIGCLRELVEMYRKSPE